MGDKQSIKRRLFLLFAYIPLLVRGWSIKKKLNVSLLSLTVILFLNALFTLYEVKRLKEHDLNLSYLVYLDFIGTLSGALFIWVIAKSVIRPLKRMVDQIESQKFVDPLNTYSADEIGDLARAVSTMKRSHSSTGEVLEEKNQLIEAILDYSIESIFMFDAEGEIVSYSRSFKERFGYQDEELNEVLLSQIIPNIHLKEILKKFSGEAPQKYFYTKELVAQNKSKKSFLIECSICPIHRKGGSVYVGIIRSLRKKNKFNILINKARERF
jgi:PAS domain S-box-containing protein